HDSCVDLTLRRGRIALTLVNDSPAAIRVRIENPNTPQQANFADILLFGKGSQVIVDLFGRDLRFTPFFKEPDNPKRVLPEYFVLFYVAQGNATIRLN